MDFPVTIKLSKPIKLGDGEKDRIISEFVISRELQAQDMVDFPADPKNQTIGSILRAFGSLAGEPPAVIKKIAWTDITQILEVMQFFLGGGA